MSDSKKVFTVGELNQVLDVAYPISELKQHPQAALFDLLASCLCATSITNGHDKEIFLRAVSCVWDLRESEIVTAAAFKKARMRDSK